MQIQEGVCKEMRDAAQSPQSKSLSASVKRCQTWQSCSWQLWVSRELGTLWLNSEVMIRELEPDWWLPHQLVRSNCRAAALCSVYDLDSAVHHKFSCQPWQKGHSQHLSHKKATGQGNGVYLQWEREGCKWWSQSSVELCLPNTTKHLTYKSH